MPASFASRIGMLRRNYHKPCCCNPWNRGQAADKEIIRTGKNFHDLRKPECDAVEAHHYCEVNSGERPDASAAHCRACRVVMLPGAVGAFLLEPVGDPFFLVDSKPRYFAGS